MELKNFKGNKPELLVDLNGNAVQAWPLGGITILMTPDTPVIARSSLIRITNPTPYSLKLYRLVDGTLLYLDSGLPILPNSSEYFSCEIGDEFQVKGSGELFITFLRNKDDEARFKVPSGSRFNGIAFLGNESTYEIQGRRASIIGGYIDYCYDPFMLGHWAEVTIGPITKMTNYPNFSCIIEKEGGVVNRFRPDDNTAPEIKIRVPITRPGETILIKLDWLGTGITDDVLTIKVDEGTILRNG